ncbi:protein SSUH2 homolog [Ptychodera flava]|uniref:protein SSUH2 homolog n=1 Tax=Ptychodera flava TaxID=63121 RepID=UPI00396A7EE1
MSYPPPLTGEVGHPPPQQGGYPPSQQGGYAPPPQQGGYPPPQQQTGYPPPQQQGGYPPPQNGYPPPQQGGYPPPQQQSGFGPSPQQGGYPPPQQQTGYPPPQQQTGYPPPQQQGLQPPTQQLPGQPEKTPQQTAPAWTPNKSAGEGGPTYKWDNVPDTDPDSDGEEMQVEQPKADMSQMASVQGYENVGVDEGGIIPPPVYHPPSEDQKPEETFAEGGKISEEEAREAMLTFVDAHCCYGSRPAKQMTITNILPGSALHYELETFTEARSTSRVYEPYRGGMVDGPMNGVAPGPWQIDIQPSGLFSDHIKYTEVPHTSTVHGCHRCGSLGFVQCGRCYGRGRVRCSSCGGDGWRTTGYTDHNGHYRSRRESCYSCGGSGRKICWRCGGDGRVTCPTCDGYCQLRWFIRLKVQFDNNLSDYILEKSDLPDELIRDVGGVILFEQTLPFVWPISCYPVAEINDNSLRIVNHHRSSWQDRRKLHQRQRLRAVPVSEAHYNWKDVSTRFWVYGNERSVYAPDYPHQCCWGCNIL